MECLSSLREANPILITHCSPSEKLLVQNELAQISQQWDDIEKTWKKRDVELEEVEATSKQYNAVYEPLMTWLTDMEQQLAEEPAVGTELDVVKEQLKKQKVRMVDELLFHYCLFSLQSRMFSSSQTFPCSLSP